MTHKSKATFKQAFKFAFKEGKFHFIHAIILIFIFLPSSGCKKENSKPDSNYSNNWPATTKPLISNKVLVVDSVKDLKTNLAAVDTVSLTFATTTTTQLLPGMILVSGVHTLAPFGFLRKIESVSTLQNGSVYCRTSQAVLTDAVINGTASRVLTARDLFGKKTISSGGLTVHNFQKSFAAAVASYDESLSFSHDFGGANLDVGIDLGATLTIEIDISGAHIDKFKADFQTTKQLSVKLESSTSFSGSYDYPLPEYPLEPITLSIAGIPVVFKAKLILSIGIDGAITGTISMDAANSTTDEVGLDYENDTWNIIKSENHNVTFNPPNVSAALDITPNAKIDLNLVPYGISNFIFESSIDLIAEFSLPVEAKVTTSNIGLTANGEIKFSGDAKAKLFDRSIVDFESTFYDITFPLFTKNFTAPTVTTNSISSVSSTSAIGGGTIINNGGLTITTKGNCWSTNNSPTVHDYKTTDGSGNANFTSKLSNLMPGVRYYVRAYASNSLGTSYGTTVSFITAQSPSQSGGPAGAPASGVPTGTGTQPPNNQPGSTTGNPGSVTGHPASNTPSSSPAIGTWSNCVPQRQNPNCGTYIDGVIDARVVNVDENNQTITFEVRKCDGTPFQNSGHVNVVSNICNGISYGFYSFSAGQTSFQVKITDTNMRYSKFYDVFVVQGTAGSYLYDAPEVTINF